MLDAQYSRAVEAAERARVRGHRLGPWFCNVRFRDWESQAMLVEYAPKRVDVPLGVFGAVLLGSRVEGGPWLDLARELECTRRQGYLLVCGFCELEEMMRLYGVGPEESEFVSLGRRLRKEVFL